MDIYVYMDMYIYIYVLWATPSAAGPRSLLIASGLQILGIVASGSWYFWDANLSFGMIGGFTLASWGTLGRFLETGEHNKGNFKVQAWIFTDFWWILLPMGVIWHAWCLYFTVLGDPGTILGRSWDIREYTKGHFIDFYLI